MDSPEPKDTGLVVRTSAWSLVSADFGATLTNSAKFQMTCAAAAVVALAVSAYWTIHYDLSESLILIGTIAGGFAAFGVWCAGLLLYSALRAPYKQRDEAWDALGLPK